MAVPAREPGGHLPGWQMGVAFKLPGRCPASLPAAIGRQVSV
jgi:hypothetical protein